MTAEILERYKVHIQEWKLIPSRGGVFEVTINDELISVVATVSESDVSIPAGFKEKK